jgi:hypothetical protein
MVIARFSGNFHSTVSWSGRFIASLGFGCEVVVHQIEEIMSGLSDFLEMRNVLLVSCCAHLLHQELGIAEDMVKRSAKIVKQIAGNCRWS